MSVEPTAPENGQPKAKIFISYSRKDMAFADRLEPALKACGFEPLIDRAEIYAFEDWWKRIEALITKADSGMQTGIVMATDNTARRHPNRAEKRALKVAELAQYVRAAGRKA